MSTDPEEQGLLGESKEEQVVSAETNGDEAPPPKSLFTPRSAAITSSIILGIGALLAYSLGTWIELAVAFGIQWIVFGLHSWPNKSEKFFDFTGMIGFVGVGICSFFLNIPVGTHNNSFPSKYVRNIIVTSMLLIWTLRLGLFLFWRILQSGADDRFDRLKDSILKFLVAWNIQGLWVFIVSLPVQALNTSARSTGYPSQIQPVEIVGWIVWGIGFIFEVVADWQKSVWKRDPENQGKFINVGLWSVSRHPNYFGEILIWWGMFIATGVVFEMRPVTIVSILSPLYTMFLLIRVSGVRMLEEKSDRKWGGQEDYEDYKRDTPVLVPFCFCWH